MISCDFETTTHAKWILAGEHAVLRGHPALVFPINEKKLTLRFYPSQSGLTADYTGDAGSDMVQLFWNVLEHGMQRLGQPLDDVHGHFHLQSNIPIGVGMGASAALCVAISRWFSSQHMLTPLEVEHFAIELEHLFHGKSSGLDIAGVAATTGIYFQKGIALPIKQTWQPQWYLSTCGQVGMTSPCIKTVQALWDTKPEGAAAIDQQMQNSVRIARKALEEENAAQLAIAINTAAECFQQWGLISTSLQYHMQTLREAGAIAVKPTGSGGGGYVVSLWNDVPGNTAMDLIAV